MLEGSLQVDPTGRLFKFPADAALLLTSSLDMPNDNKLNLVYFEASSIRQLYEAMNSWQHESRKRLLSLNIQQDKDLFCCIALTNPTEVVITDRDGFEKAINVVVEGQDSLCDPIKVVITDTNGSDVPVKVCITDRNGFDAPVNVVLEGQDSLCDPIQVVITDSGGLNTADVSSEGKLLVTRHM